MTKKTKHGWQCSFCGSVYTKETDAFSCEKSHEIVLVEFRREDLFRLIQFIYTRDEELLTKSLMKTLMKYKKGITK